MDNWQALSLILLKWVLKRETNAVGSNSEPPSFSEKPKNIKYSADLSFRFSFQDKDSQSCCHSVLSILSIVRAPIIHVPRITHTKHEAVPWQRITLCPTLCPHTHVSYSVCRLVLVLVFVLQISTYNQQCLGHLPKTHKKGSSHTSTRCPPPSLRHSRRHSCHTSRANTCVRSVPRWR